MNRNKTIASIIVLLTISLLVASIPQTKAQAQFALASWDFPDEYGQGIESIALYENASGYWQPKSGTRWYYQNHMYDWDVGVGIKLYVYTLFNSTLTGASDSNEGKLLQQHSVIVTSAGQTIFSQQNFTYTVFSDADDPMWDYGYFLILDFLPQQGQIYKVTVTYEIWW